MSIYMTDGTFVSGKEPRKYKVIAGHGNYIWVECLDGTMKTFLKTQLKRVTS